MLFSEAVVDVAEREVALVKMVVAVDDGVPLVGDIAALLVDWRRVTVGTAVPVLGTLEVVTVVVVCSGDAVVVTVVVVVGSVAVVVITVTFTASRYNI